MVKLDTQCTHCFDFLWKRNTFNRIKGSQLHHQSERLERDCSELHLVGSYCWEALEWSAAERPQEKYENTKILKFKNTELQKYRDT